MNRVEYVKDVIQNAADKHGVDLKTMLGIVTDFKTVQHMWSIAGFEDLAHEVDTNPEYRVGELHLFSDCLEPVSSDVWYIARLKSVEGEYFVFDDRFGYEKSLRYAREITADEHCIIIAAHKNWCDQKHKVDVSIVDLISKEMRTSAEWNKVLKFEIIDPDGWDRANYDYSFNIERITEDEFMKRVSMSTRKLTR